MDRDADHIARCQTWARCPSKSAVSRSRSNLDTQPWYWQYLDAWWRIDVVHVGRLSAIEMQCLVLLEGMSMRPETSTRRGGREPNWIKSTRPASPRRFAPSSPKRLVGPTTGRPRLIGQGACQYHGRSLHNLVSTDWETSFLWTCVFKIFKQTLERCLPNLRARH